MKHALEDVPLEKLVPHPRNTRGKIGKEDVADLAASMKAVGMLDPLIVRLQPDDGSRYQILAGHRRAVAAQVAGLDVVKAQLVALDDDQADAVLVLSNRDREEPDLFREANAVRSLLEGKGWKVKDVAGLLGKSPGFVAELRAIADLEASVAKAMQSEKCSWTPDMVALFAGLAPEVQKVKWTDLQRGHRRIESVKDLRDCLGDEFRTIGSAPWDVADETLVPKAGSCARCPKTSLRAPGLFDEGDLDPEDPAALKKAVCRDGTCWAGKALAHLKRQTEALHVEHGIQPALVSEAFGEDLRRLKDVAPVVEKWNVKEATKGDKGACPAIVVGGKDDGKVKWIKGASEPDEGGGRAKKSKAAKPKALTVEDRLERLEARRNAWIVDHVQDAIAKLSPANAPYPVVRTLVAMFGGRSSTGFDWQTRNVGKLRDMATPTLKDDQAWAEATWPHVREVARQRLARVGLDQADKQVNDALFVAELMGADLPALWDKAAKEIPTPKALQGARAEKSLPRPAAAKKASGKKKAAAVAD